MLEVHNTVILVAETTPHAVSNLLRARTPSNRAEFKSRKTEVNCICLDPTVIYQQIHCEDASWVFEVVEHANKLSVAQTFSVVS